MPGAFTEKIKYQFSTADTLKRLLIINVAVFLTARIINSLSGLFMIELFDFQQLSKWLAVPAAPEKLLVRPWTLITYMFYHWDFMHILFNMLWLFWMGKIFQEYLGNKKLLVTYILGGLCGAIFYILAYNIFPLFNEALPDSYALGASASVLAITVAAATLLPDYPIQLFIFGRIPLKWIAAITILLDVISVSGSNAGGHIAHLGGAIFGFVYIKQLRMGRDPGKWLSDLFDKFSMKRRSPLKVHYSKTKNDEEFIVNKKVRQEHLDEILDKISKSGYGSLTSEERDFLFKSSKDEGKQS